MGRRYGRPPSAASWARPPPTKPERWRSRSVLTRIQSPLPPPLLTLSLCASPQLNATSSTSSATSNSTMRSAFCGTVCRSPVPRPPLSANKVGFSSETRELRKRAKKKLRCCVDRKQADASGYMLHAN